MYICMYIYTSIYLGSRAVEGRPSAAAAARKASRATAMSSSSAISSAR